VQSDTLRVVTVPSSVSIFPYKGGWRGHEYEKIKQVADDLNLQLHIALAPNEQAVFDSLALGVADVAAWPVFSSVAAARGNLLTCGYTYPIGLVALTHGKLQHSDTASYRLVVPDKSRAWMVLNDTTVLRHFDTTPYLTDVLPADSLSAEQLTEQVAAGKYDAILLPANMAQLMHSFYRNLEVGKPIEGSTDSVSWAVAAQADTLAAKIDSVCHYNRSVPHYAAIVKRYYEQSLGKDVKINYLLGNGRLSVYDGLFRRFAPQLGWDWRMLAAVAYVESRFDPQEVSAKGARGLMQLMPQTGRRFGCPEALLSDPEANIQAGVNLLVSLETSLRSRVSRTLQPGIEQYAQASEETQKRVEKDLVYYTLASYNAGLGHIFDAIALADTLQLDPGRWRGNVEYTLTLKGDSAYYNLPCVHAGRFNADVTLNYVGQVLNAYALFCTLVDE